MTTEPAEGFPEVVERRSKGKKPEGATLLREGRIGRSKGKKKGRDARRAWQSEDVLERHNLREELTEAWRR